MAEKEGMIAAGQCSAKTGEGIQEAFQLLITNSYEKLKSKGRFRLDSAFDLSIQATKPDKTSTRPCC
jgi:hypothetical protein